jgi:23S rRNA (uracil1939-C5)-methyltransferase
MLITESVVSLTSFAYGGDALGRLPDGRAVFVPFGIPGETVRVKLTEEKRGHARGEIVAVLEASPQRISPRCPHFGVCGGCHYQHLPYPAQLEAKTAILRDQLVRLGGLEDPPIRPIVPSPSPWNYRNQVQFHLDPQGRLGYQQARSHQVVAIRECHLPEEVINLAWPLLELDPQADIERVSLKLGAGDDLQVVLEGESPEPPEFSVEGLPLSAVHLSPAGALVLAGSEYIVMEVLGHPFRVSAGAFFQVNTPMAAAMVQHLLANLPVKPGDSVLDVYCGVGLFSLFLAEKAGRLVAVESSPAACEDFAVNLDAFDNVDLYEAPAEDVLPYLQEKPQAVVVDPPRAGLEPRTLDALLKLGASTLAYVSCDPATLGRDARRLSAGGYRLRQITPFDLFPQTYHIESISFWARQ